MAGNSKKILLLNPPFKYLPGYGDRFLNYSRPPLGLAYIAAFLRSKYDAKVTIFDALNLNLSIDEAVNYIGEFKPDILGISTATPTIKTAKIISKDVRKIIPDIFIVFGGPHVTVLPYEGLDTADAVVIGEGEEAFYEIAKGFFEKAPLQNIPGIAIKQNGNFIKTQDRPLIPNLDLLPFPARDLLRNYKYNHIYPYGKNKMLHSIITSRGCRYNCYFCLNKAIWKQTVRYRTLPNIFAEIEELASRQDNSILFFDDDDFLENRQRAYEICEFIGRRFPQLKWLCHARCSSVSEGILKEMKKAGCVEIQMGIENGDNRILANCNKHLTTDVIEEAVRKTKKAGINVWGTFIIGAKGETPATIKKTIKFSKSLGLAYATFIFLSPLPGTRFFKEFSSLNYIKTLDWDKYTWHGEPVFETPELTRGLLMKYRGWAYFSFYMRPNIILKYLITVFKTGDLRTMARNLLILLRFIFLPKKTKQHS